MVEKRLCWCEIGRSYFQGAVYLAYGRLLFAFFNFLAIGIALYCIVSSMKKLAFNLVKSLTSKSAWKLGPGRTGEAKDQVSALPIVSGRTGTRKF